MIFLINRKPDAHNAIKYENSNFAGVLGSGYDNIPLLEPHPGYGLVDVVNKFAWTKTRSIDKQHYNIPTLTMEEMYITSPGFIANIKRAVGQLGDSVNTSGLTDWVKEMLSRSKEQIDSGAADVLDKIVQGTKDVAKGLDDMTSFNTLDVNKEKFKYMSPYSAMYGVQASRFRYRLPYFVDTFKKVSNNFDSGITERISESVIGKSLENISGLMSTGFGIDFAKVYNYSSEGPSTTFSFLLDNTYDSFTGAWNAPSSYQQNWELIFLLLYQNLPAKINTILVQPPVVYSARLPGVFRYLYSYMSSLEVECLGNRTEREVIISEQSHVNHYDVSEVGFPSGDPRDGQLTQSFGPQPFVPEGWTAEQAKATQAATVPGDVVDNKFTTIIPEAFRVTITLQSLLPETKNLLLYSLEDKMQTINIRKSNYKLVPDDRKLTKEEDLGDLAGYTPEFVPPAMIAYHSEYPGDIENSFTYKGYQDVGSVQGGGVDPLQSGG